jgi:hypothetical protein
MRPTYENAASLNNEREVVEYICSRFGLTSDKLPVSYRADYALSKMGKIHAFAEVKCRTNPKDRYPTYMLALGKYMALCEMAKYAQITSRLIVRWADCIGYVDLPCEIDDVVIGGRTDRNDSADVEPVVHIPISAFTIITSHP